AVAKVVKITPGGTVSDFVGTGTQGDSGDGGDALSAHINLIEGMCFDADDNLYLADFNAGGVRKVNHSDNKINTIAGTGTAGFSGDGGAATSAQVTPVDVALNSAGDVFIADYTNNRIRKIDHTSGNISTIAGNGTAGSTGDGGAATSAELNAPISIVFDADG